MMKPSDVKRIRKELGVTGAELAKMLKTTRITVWRWESGETKVSPANQQLLEILLERHRQRETAPARRATREAAGQTA